VKKILILTLALVLLLGMAAPVMAAKPVPEPIDKVVFIHYPQGSVAYWSPAKAPAPTDQDETYKYHGVHWSTEPVSYYDADGNLLWSTTWPVQYYVNAVVDRIQAINDSFKTWEDERNSNMLFAYVGITTSGDALDGKNVVSWQNISDTYPRAIAVTSIWSYRFSKVIIDVDTVMNSGDGFNWSVNTGGDPDAYDVQNIMTNEAGHWLMLGDLYSRKTQELTMFGFGTPGEIKKRTLGVGDELGIQAIYGE